jgi:asparagine synthase (glutamine-hydrolysing)
MCGWSGIWQSGGASRQELCEQARIMADTLMHRGPDDEGTWADPEAGVAFGFRRLAIVDLSPEGHQPMCSESGRYVIAFNGEVYNFTALRQPLESLGHRFRGHSDTEVILAAIEEWGLEAAVRQFVGMFAFALWDKHDRTLSLVRDRIGIKPLYYGWMGRTFLCGSELKALRAHPSFHPHIDTAAVALYMRHNYVPTPYSIYQGIAKLPPGSILTLSSPTDRPTPVPYWSLKEIAEQGIAHPFSGSEDEAGEHLERVLREAVALRMVADVPLGAFLSGGVDSSLVVAHMQIQSRSPVKTFSIGFREAGYDEARHAHAVAAHLGTEHTELYVTPADAQAVIPDLPTIYDEPFADSSQVPTFLVSKLTRKHVTVSLSGDGGDELFGGYDRYPVTAGLWSVSRRIPYGIRRAMSSSITKVSPKAYDRSLGRIASVFPIMPAGSLGRRAHTVADLLNCRTSEDLYTRVMSHWGTPEEVVHGAREPSSAVFDLRPNAGLPTFTHRMMYLDTLTYLPDDILTKVDRASMAVSLEVRVPLLDHRVVEFAWSLPLSMKIMNGQSKRILRRMLYKHVPSELIERPKQGFAVPIGAWLRGPLSEWANTLLDEKRLRQQDVLDPGPIRRMWAEHLSGARDWQAHLWVVLMFEAWYDRWCS